MFSLVSDLVSLMRPGELIWRDIAFYAIVAGLVGAVPAAIAGFIDFLAIRSEKVKRIATIHLGLMVGVVLLYVVGLVVRSTWPDGSIVPVVLSLVTILALIWAAWLGGEMVFRHGAAVHPQASDSKKVASASHDSHIEANQETTVPDLRL